MGRKLRGGSWLAVLVALVIGVVAGVAGVKLGDAPSVTVVPSVDASKVPPSQISAMYGKKQAQVHLAAVKVPPIVQFIRALNVGDSGPFVFQLQRALKKAHFRKGRSTGFYGKGTAHQVARFQRSVHIRPSGRYGKPTHFKLSKYYDAEGRGRLLSVAHTRLIIERTSKIVTATAWAWKHRMSMAYSQSGSRAFLPLLPGFPRATDCSGYFTWVFKASGLTDPNGFAYRIVGYTGTLAQHGIRISANGALHVGDAVFYGGGYPYGHVAIVVDAIRRLVSSHGSPGIHVEAFNYRPVSTIRRYFG